MPDRELNSARYAIYFVPAPDSTLYRFGAEFLGYDCYTGVETPKPAWCDLPEAAWQRLTSAPRKYGFHGTLKAPFRLRPGVGEADLTEALDSFAAKSRPLPPVRLKLQAIGDFAALVPDEPSAELNEFASDCVEVFDRFRAPLTQEERQRRLADGLTDRQAAYLDRYGYPYVSEEFRFHLTLTGKITKADWNDFIPPLQTQFAFALPDPALAVTAISIVRQNSAASPFRLLHQAMLGVAPRLNLSTRPG
jgi:putative phosphonate metabolism protein